MIQGWFQGGPSFRQDDEPASLLEGWKRYEAEAMGEEADPEAGGPSTSASASAPSSGGPAASGAGAFGLDVNPFFRNASESVAGAWTSMSKNVQDLPSNIHKTATSMPSQRAVMYFTLTLATGVFFMFLAFTVFLPVIVLAPQKFAICFTIGCLLVMGAFFVLKGPTAQLQSMLVPERLPFTLFFVGSMAFTLYASMVMHSYIFSVLSSGAQVLALAYYVVSFFPGGTAGLRFLTGMFTSTVRGVIGV